MMHVWTVLVYSYARVWPDEVLVSVLYDACVHSVGHLLAMVLLLLDSVISICTPSKPLTVFVT